MTLNIGLVTEGPTDVVIIQGLLDHILNKPLVTNILQPLGSPLLGYGSNGAGWKGVKRWCEEVSTKYGFESYLLGTTPYDLLILQMDIDVSRDQEINCYIPTSPIQETIDAFQNEICSWLGISEVKRPFIMLLPADNLEAWILAYLSDDQKYEPIEEYHKPDKLIAKRPFAVKKSTRNYQLDVLPNLIGNWDKIKMKCSQAKKFESDILFLK